MEIGGLPLHPLVVHGTVVLIPLTALLTAVFGVLPGWRWLTRWPTALMAVVATGIAWAAVLSGKALLESRPELGQLVETHQDRGQLLAWVMIPFALLALLSTWALGGRSALESGRGEWSPRVPVLSKVLPIVLVLAALVVIVLTVRTGDSGARAVWG